MINYLAVIELYWMLLVALTFALFRRNVITLYKDEKQIDNPLLQGLFSFGFPIVYIMCFINYIRGEEDDNDV